MNDKTLVHIDGNIFYYKNDMTQLLTKHCKSSNSNKHPSLFNHKVFLVENRTTGAMGYVLFDSRGIPIYENTVAEAVYAHIDILRLSKAR